MTDTTTTQTATTTTQADPTAAVSQGFNVPEWLPGVDTDTAKFIVGKTVADLPSLAKGYAEAQKALSAPRPFEMPKEGDVDGMKKMLAGLGVPEKPEYDFGEQGKTLPDDVKKFWGAELHKLGIPTKAAQGLVGLVAAQAKATQDAQEAAFATQAAKAVESKLLEWGDKADANKDLAARGIGAVFEKLKIENTLENRAKFEKAFGTDKMLEFGVLMGRQMVEAGFVMQDGQRQGLTKDSAVLELKAMMSDGNIAKALVDKTHADHQRHLARKIQLENIAHS
jgi:hypothetical protein